MNLDFLSPSITEESDSTTFTVRGSSPFPRVRVSVFFRCINTERPPAAFLLFSIFEGREATESL